MKMETLIFAILTGFFAVITPVYWLLSHEIAGSVALLLTFFLTFIITSYVFLTARNMAARPEDRLDGEISDATGQVGFFSPYSSWPLWTAASFAICVLGIALAWWMVIIGVVFLLASIIGMCFEYYREAPESRPSSRQAS